MKTELFIILLLLITSNAYTHYKQCEPEWANDKMNDMG